MRLSLAGWPPVASHVACLILGVSLAHLANGTGEDGPPQLPPRALVVSLPTAAGHGVPRILIGKKVQLVRRTPPPGRTSCHLAGGPFTLLALRPLPLLGAGYSAAPELARILKAAGKGDLRLLAANSAGTLPPCAHQPKVIYGTP